MGFLAQPIIRRLAPTSLRRKARCRGGADLAWQVGEDFWVRAQGNLPRRDEMIAKKNDYLWKATKEYPEGIPLDEISDPNIGLNILMDVFGKKPGTHIRGLEYGRVREIEISRSSASTQHLQKEVNNLKDELTVVKIAQKASTKEVDHLRDELTVAKTSQEAFNKEFAYMRLYLQKLVQNMSRVPGFEPPPVDFEVPSIDAHSEDDGQSSLG